MILAFVASLVTLQVSAQTIPPGYQKIASDQLPMSFKLKGWQDRSWLEGAARRTAGIRDYKVWIIKDAYSGVLNLVMDKQGFVLPQKSMKDLVQEHATFKGATFVFGADGIVTQGAATYRYILFDAERGGTKGSCVYLLGDWQPGLIEGHLCHPTKPINGATAQVFLKSIEIEGVSREAAGSLN